METLDARHVERRVVERTDGPHRIERSASKAGEGILVLDAQVTRPRSKSQPIDDTTNNREIVLDQIGKGPMRALAEEVDAVEAETRTNFDNAAISKRVAIKLVKPASDIRNLGGIVHSLPTRHETGIIERQQIAGESPLHRFAAGRQFTPFFARPGKKIVEHRRAVPPRTNCMRT